MKHYNPDLENKILADLTPRRTGTDHGFLSFVKADASTDVVAGVEVVESNHIWIDVAADDEIIYESANTVMSQLAYIRKVWDGVGAGDKISSTTWQRNGDGSIQQVNANYTRRNTRATGYIERNDTSTYGTYSGALGTIPNGPNAGQPQVVTPTVDFVDTNNDSVPFHYNPVSFNSNLFKQQNPQTEKVGCVLLDYDNTAGVDNFTFDETKAYIPRATVLIDVAVGISTSTFAAPVVATSEWFSSAQNRYQTYMFTAEPILVGRTYSTPGVNGGQPYTYNPNSGRTDADILSNIYPASVTTNAAGDLVDAGIYDFGYDFTDTLTYFIQITHGLSVTTGLTTSISNLYIANPANQGKGLLTGILPGVSSLYYGDQINESIVTEMVTGTSLGFFTDVEVQGGGVTADGDITTDGAVNAAALNVANLLTVLPRQIYSKSFESQTSQTVTEDANSASLSFTGPGRFPEEGGAPGIYFTTVDEDADYYFVASTGGLTLGLQQVFKYTPSPGNFSITEVIGSSPVSFTTTYNISNPSAIQKLKASALTTLQADPTLTRDWDGQVIFELDDDDFESITTGDVNTLASGRWDVSIEPGESRDVLIDQDLNIGGTLTIEGGINANGPICAPYDVDHYSATATLVKCAVSYITSLDSAADRMFNLPVGEVGDWIKLAIRPGRNDTNAYRFTPSQTPNQQLFEGEAIPSSADPDKPSEGLMVVQPGHNTAIELTYISNAIGWAITSAS